MMSVIIRRAAAAAGFSVLALCCSLQAAEQVNPARKVIALDRIIAIVNDDVITKQELDDRVALARKELRDQNTPEPPAEVLARQTLERMIYMRVQLQYAKETGLRVDDAALDAAINRIAEGNKMRVEQLRDTLEKDGMRFAQFREDIRDEIAVSRLREREVDNKIIITDSEVDSLLASSQGPGATPEEYNLLHILVRVPEQASPEQLQARRARRTGLGPDQGRHRLPSGGRQFFRRAGRGAGWSDGLAGIRAIAHPVCAGRKGAQSR